MDKEKSIAMLNKALADELQSIEQYLYFHFYCENLGYDPLSKIFMRISIVEMHHMDRLAQRILFLDGDVDMRVAGPIRRIHEAAEMVEVSRGLEQETINEYNSFAEQAGSYADSATKTLFESLIREEEAHFDIFDTEFKNIKKFGDSYLALQALGGSKESAKEDPKVN